MLQQHCMVTALPHSPVGMPLAFYHGRELACASAPQHSPAVPAPCPSTHTVRWSGMVRLRGTGQGGGASPLGHEGRMRKGNAGGLGALPACARFVPVAVTCVKACLCSAHMPLPHPCRTHAISQAARPMVYHFSTTGVPSFWIWVSTMWP